jgi:outer membrane protein OmpA-like peptidoglycan-associated protein
VDQPFDGDGDGVTWCAGDCDNQNPATRPGAPEICDGLDNDCDSRIDSVEVDADGDGWAPCDGDCDESDASVHPQTAEDCSNGIDDDCDGSVDESTDADGDGATCEQDCNDLDARVFRQASELCDGLDNDCDGLFDEDFDFDQDGYPDGSDPACQGLPEAMLDCDDFRNNISPGAAEFCNGQGVDEDCDGERDENPDLDGDGWGECNGDCNDQTPTISPGAPDVCDGLDNDCNGTVDDNQDRDADGYTICNGDCNDGNAAINPLALEECDGQDNNCDEAVDEGLDADGDGFCGQWDCDDEDPTINSGPDALESCDGRDNDCDGRIDGDFDQDGDGVTVCGPDGIPGTSDDDCLDTGENGPYMNPGAREQCSDTLDNDCDGLGDSDDDDCPGLGLRPHPFGFGCHSAPGAGPAPLAVALLLLVVAWRPRRPGSSAALLALLLLVAPVASAETQVLFLSDDARTNEEDVRADLRARDIDAASVQVTRLDRWLSENTPALVFQSLAKPRRCSTASTEQMDADEGLERGRELAYELEHHSSNIALQDAIRDLPCADLPLDRRTLSELFFYQGYNRLQMGDEEVAYEDFIAALSIDPLLRWDPALSRSPPELFLRAQAAAPGGPEVKLRQPVARLQEAELLVHLTPPAVVSFWLDGDGLVPGRFESRLAPGRHFLQWAGPDHIVDGVVLELRPGERVEAVGIEARIEAILQAGGGALAARRAWAYLEDGFRSAPIPDEFLVVDLRSDPKVGDAPALSFDSNTRVVAAVSTLSELEAQRYAAGRRPYVRDYARFVLHPGIAYFHPFLYLDVGVDVEVALARHVLLDVNLGASWGSSQNPFADGAKAGAILPHAAVGAGFTLDDSSFRPAVSFRFVAGLDRLEDGGVYLAPGGDLSLLLDLLPTGSSPIVLRLRLRGGVQAYRFLNAQAQASTLKPLPSASAELGFGFRLKDQGAGTGQVDLCPDEDEDLDGYEDDDGCADPDNDGDGIEDASDACPMEAETFDGVDDDDGCPERDQDGDGLVDATDDCPAEAEDLNGVQDDDGCPDGGPAWLELAGGKPRSIALADPLRFADGGALDPASHATLDAVAGILVAYPQVLLVEVAAHTDDRGEDEADEELSQAQAEATVDYLVNLGIEGSRLDAVGYGAGIPLADNDSEAGREANRRIELIVIDASDEPLIAR